MSDPTRERKLTFRGGGFVIEQRTWISVLAFVVLIALWQLATGVGQTGAGATQAGAVTTVPVQLLPWLCAP